MALVGQRRSAGDHRGPTLTMSILLPRRRRAQVPQHFERGRRVVVERRLQLLVHGGLRPRFLAGGETGETGIVANPPALDVGGRKRCMEEDGVPRFSLAQHLNHRNF